MNAISPGNASLSDSLTALARTGLDFAPFLTTVTTHQAVDDTRVLAHCHHVAFDGSCLPRLQDFTDYVADWVLDYVIPRRTLMEASSASEVETRLKNQRLRRQAIETFKRTGVSGEQGEMLLFVLAESLLRLPQLLCKMDLKTDRSMHFHGLDGIHCGPGNQPDRLAVYWCESKVHKDLDGALSEAFDGLKPFLTSAGTGTDDKRRELALLDRYMDLGDPALQELILKSLNPNSTEFNEVSWRGICLVGFDYEYPSKPNTKSAGDFHAEISLKFKEWTSKIKSRATHRELETFEIHVLFVPFGFCDDFRTCMLKSLGLVT